MRQFIECYDDDLFCERYDGMDIEEEYELEDDCDYRDNAQYFNSLKNIYNDEDMFLYSI